MGQQVSSQHGEDEAKQLVMAVVPLASAGVEETETTMETLLVSSLKWSVNYR